MTERIQESRYALVTAAHHFLHRVLPIRKVESRVALEDFVAEATRYRLPTADIDAVLIQCLIALDPRGASVPTLLDRYLDLAVDREPMHPMRRFSMCMDDAIRFYGINDTAVQRAVTIMEECYGDSALTLRAIAAKVARRPPQLAVAFKQQMSVTVGEYLRNLRLARSAALLRSTDKTIKEVWCRAGYNHPSNFNHDFKRRFGVTPGVYRMNAARLGWAVRNDVDDTIVPPAMRSDGYAQTRGTVLIVDDDESSRTSIGCYLSLEGYTVVLAETAAAGLREAGRVLPAAILLDYRLPDLNGLECLRALRQRALGSAPAVAIFTADFDVFDHQEDVHALHAIIASKLCALEDIRQLVDYLIDMTRQKNSWVSSGSGSLPSE
jgi:AraC-like DNA-binding protein/CheY-like chemotaxis protein